MTNGMASISASWLATSYVSIESGNGTLAELSKSFGIHQEPN